MSEWINLKNSEKYLPVWLREGNILVRAKPVLAAAQRKTFSEDSKMSRKRQDSADQITVDPVTGQHMIVPGTDQTGGTADDPITVADRMAKARAARGKVRKSNQSNRPVYMVMGIPKMGGAFTPIQECKTIFKARKFTEEQPVWVTNNFNQLQIWRCKVVE